MFQLPVSDFRITSQSTVTFLYGSRQFAQMDAEERIRATYGDNYDRLAAIKKKYDPTNFFRVNQNIKPA